MHRLEKDSTYSIKKIIKEFPEYPHSERSCAHLSSLLTLGVGKEKLVLTKTNVLFEGLYFRFMVKTTNLSTNCKAAL